MAFAELIPVTITQTVPGTVDAVAGSAIDMRQFTDKGFAITRGAGAAWTGTIQGSVNGVVWSDIAVLDVTKQGGIDGFINWVRLNVTVAGALGTATALWVAGKEIA